MAGGERGPRPGTLAALHEGWARTTLWTRTDNARARRLYEKAGYRPTGRTSTLAEGDGIMQLAWVR
ncbi:hypothetical protein ABT297_06670 [Dactylosporangium sp. NPDC000555]|uniref:hypothetical protein n=1 Tax=Dactylosporangium sp. NPDC000555 TaxID=3154260 RepID=UPI003320510A